MSVADQFNDQMGAGYAAFRGNLLSAIQGTGLDFSSVRAAPTSADLPSAYGLHGLQSGTTYNTAEDAAFWLARAKSLDPNARIRQITNPTDSSMGFALDFDESKLPKPQHAGLLPMGEIATGDRRLRDESAVFNDPNYGPMVQPGNIAARRQGTDWLSILGPLIVGGFTGIGAAGGLSGLFGGAMGANPVGMGSVNFARNILPFLTRGH